MLPIVAIAIVSSFASIAGLAYVAIISDRASVARLEAVAVLLRDARN